MSSSEDHPEKTDLDSVKLLEDTNDDAEVEFNAIQQSTKGEQQTLAASIPKGGYWKEGNLTLLSPGPSSKDWQGEQARSTISNVGLGAALGLRTPRTGVQISGSTAKLAQVNVHSRMQETPSSSNVETSDDAGGAATGASVDQPESDTEQPIDTFSIAGSTSTSARRRKLRAANLTDEVLSALTVEVISKLMKQFNTSGNLSEYITTVVMQSKEEIRKWVMNVLEAQSKAETVKESSLEMSTTKLSERIDLLDKKISALFTENAQAAQQEQDILSEGLKLMRENQERRKRYREKIGDYAALRELVEEDNEDGVSLAESDRQAQLKARVEELEKTVAQYEAAKAIKVSSQDSIETIVKSASFSPTMSSKSINHQLMKNLRGLK